MKKEAKVGLFGIGLDTYWAQFDGLLDHLKNYQEQIKTGLPRLAWKWPMPEWLTIR